MIIGFMRKNVHVIMWILVVGTVFTFVFWGVGTQYGGRQGPRYAGKLFGRKVSFETYSEALELSRMEALLAYGANLPQIERFLNLPQQAWDRLILFKEAKSMGLRVTDPELSETLQRIQVFQRDGRFSYPLYERILQSALRTTPRRFEEMMRKGLLIHKLREKIGEEVAVRPEEVRLAYQKLHEKIRLTCALASTEELASSVKPSEADLKTFYEKSPERFARPEEAVVRFLRVAKETDRETARKKAQEIFNQILENQTIETAAGEAGLKVEESGAFAQGEEIPGLGALAQVSEEAFSLKPAEVGSIAEDEKAFIVYVLKERLPARTPAFEEVREKVREIHTAEKAEKLAREQAEGWTKKISETKDLSGGSRQALEKALGHAVVETALVSRDESIDKIGAAGPFVDAAVDKSAGTWLGVVKTETGYAVARVEERAPAPEDAFEKERADLEKSLLEAKRTQHFLEWFRLIKTRARLESNI